jgi:hypothetical protein
MEYKIGHAKRDDYYFVYDNERAIIYKGNYVQCLIVIGGLALDYSLEEVMTLANPFSSY